MSNNKDSFDDNVLVAPSKPKLKKPKMYQVVLVNDDYTPMEFVIEILESFFSHERHQATKIMLNVHKKGKGVCGIFSKDVAETKVMQVNQFSRENQHPLLCEMEVSQ